MEKFHIMNIGRTFRVKSLAAVKSVLVESSAGISVPLKAPTRNLKVGQVLWTE